MAQKHVLVDGIGEVIVGKRRKTKNLRLSVNSRGQVKVTIPIWAPYSTAISFAKNKQIWINQQLAEHRSQVLQHGMAIGKAHRLNIINGSPASIKTRITQTEIIITTDLPIYDKKLQLKISQACEEALRKEATKLLPQRAEDLANRYGYNYQSVRIKKLTARWGSCSNDKVITLSYYLMQLPWQLIDYVILHELIHTAHLHHGQDFWQEFTRHIPNVRQLRKEIKSYRPRIQPSLR